MQAGSGLPYDESLSYLALCPPSSRPPSPPAIPHPVRRSSVIVRTGTGKEDRGTVPPHDGQRDGIHHGLASIRAQLQGVSV